MSEDKWRKEISQIWQRLVSRVPFKIPIPQKESSQTGIGKENSVSIVITSESSAQNNYANQKVKLSGGFGGFLHGIDLKTFLDTMIESKQMRYETIEDKKLMWMALERGDDPDESIFKLLMKIEKRNGKSHEEIEKRIQKWLALKLRSEMTYQEFEDHFLIHFCKFVRK